jgi:hypothetical protein
MQYKITEFGAWHVPFRKYNLNLTIQAGHEIGEPNKKTKFKKH